MSADVTAQKSVGADRLLEPAGGPPIRTRTPVALAVLVGLLVLGALLAALSRLVGLHPVAVGVGSACGIALSAGLARAASGAATTGLGPADRVTVGRAVLACGVAALTVELVAGRPVTSAILVLAVPALALDAVDGWVARRTETATPLGARLDGEADAFLILVLSVAVGSLVGWWVVAAGLARYLFATAGFLLPWMRRPLPYRYWRKVVTAALGVVLVVALTDLVPPTVLVPVVVLALVLLAESFGRDVWWLWLRRHQERDSTAETPGQALSLRPIVATGLAVLAVLVGWFALLTPTRPDRITPLAFTRIPLEALVAVGLVLALASRSQRSARVLAAFGGALLGVMTVLKALDIGAFAVLDRPFTVITDHALLGSGLDFVRDSAGPWVAGGALAAALVLLVAVLIGVPVAAVRLAGVLTRRSRAGLGAVLTLSLAWVAHAAAGARWEPGGPVASLDAARFAVDKATATVDAVRDQRRFEQAVADDAFRRPARGELAALRGKDVVVVFVESYGRAALDGPDMAPVRSLLDAGTEELGAVGYQARSGFLTSPTFGGSSWLAHASLMSGLWVDDQQRYDRVLSSSRSTITSVFARNGWRTVAVLPSNRQAWPEGQRFYDVDTVYDRTNLGYAGPSFGFSGMPDQFALASFTRQELAVPTRPPVMAHVALTSSHGPWAPLPTTVDPADLGDGSVFESIRADATSAADLWSDRDEVPDAYRTALRYSLHTVIDFIRGHETEGMVVLLVGDHQPGTIVSGFGGNRDVPVTVIADDPAVLERVDAWGWEAGLRPSDDAPVWPMGEFRDRFLTAFSGPAGP